MLVLSITAALLLDPTPKQKALLQEPQPAAQAVRQEASGRTLASVAVTLECTARANGLVENCKVLGETHPGLGFGDAALALMRDARVEPGSDDIQFARTIQFLP
ncbi:TonB family protein [Brevundimonas alba]|uniref:TonB family protein n=1 Tax=Brevundimonas alba TaxID=74314 RepID=A0A7X5YNC4_9CAUL|nr:energy transducer TonB [Brevundimonas alba]NJC41695.1 TonB family protein [Brevundimonas alba]